MYKRRASDLDDGVLRNLSSRALIAQEREKSFSGNLSGILTSSVFNSVGTLVAFEVLFDIEICI